MPTASFARQLRALMLRDAREALVNPVVSAMALVSIGLPFVYIIAFGTGNAQTNFFTASIGLTATLATPSTTVTAFVLLEEWEHGTFPPMLRAGATPAAIVCARLTVAFLATLIALAVCLAAVGIALPQLAEANLPALVLACAPCALTCCAATLACALVIRTQQHLYTCCAFVLTALVVGLLQPMLGVGALELLPMGPAVAALGALAFGVPPLMGWAPLVLASALWLAASLTALLFATRRFATAVHACI